MSFADHLLKRLFKSKSPSGLPVVEEKLRRSERYTEAYELWKTRDAYSRRLDEIYLSYHLKKQNEQSSFLEVHLLNSPYSNGFALTYHPDFSYEEFSFLFDYFSERVQELEYRHYTSDRRIYDRAGYVEAIEKHYHKPKQPQELQDKKLEQRFGNILIEQVLIDDKPSFIRLMAHVYSDRKFHAPNPFEGLLDHLLEKK